jgi:transcriptional regulator with PAS, ATPase and Fis domain
MMQSGEFRQDLYYRINVVPVVIPPLRERRGDLALLIDHFVQHYNRVYGKSIEALSPEAMRLLLDYHYPGNIRELENILQHAFVLCQGTTITTKHLPAHVITPEQKAQKQTSADSWQDFDKRRIEDALARNRYSRLQTARELGMHTSTLWRKMKRYGIEG